MIKKQKKQKCQYCKGYSDTFEDSNHIIGCNLEAIAQTLRFRGWEEEAKILDNVASRIK